MMHLGFPFLENLRMRSRESGLSEAAILPRIGCTIAELRYLTLRQRVPCLREQRHRVRQLPAAEGETWWLHPSTPPFWEVTLSRHLSLRNLFPKDHEACQKRQPQQKRSMRDWTSHSCD